MLKRFETLSKFAAWAARSFTISIILGAFFIVGLFAISFVIMLFGPEAQHRSAVYYARMELRSLHGGLEEYYLIHHRYPPEGPYWGPLTPALAQTLGADPNAAIDPYNREGDSHAWRTGPRYSVDRGANILIKGLDYHYFTDGRDRWALVSRGPDGDLDVSSATLSQVAPGSGWEARSCLLAPWLYDPSNGTVSGGDIIRLKD